MPEFQRQYGLDAQCEDAVFAARLSPQSPVTLHYHRTGRGGATDRFGEGVNGQSTEVKVKLAP